MTITYNSTMSGTTVKKFVVKNKTRRAKYNTDKVKLEIEGKPGTSPFYLYKRKNGDVSFAQGDMAATVVAVKEETLVEFTTKQIKMAYGVANDKRYKGGNYSGAVAAIEKIAKGLSSHPAVQNVLKRTNEDVQEMAKDKAYAIGMSTAKKKYNDEPPLDKQTNKKAHEIGDKLSKM